MANSQHMKQLSEIIGAIFLAIVANVNGYTQITQCLIVNDMVDPQGCDIIDNPFVYSGQCEIGMNRLIGRAVATYGLSQYNNSDYCYGVGLHDSDFNCNPPYNLCWGKCPFKYCEIIRGATDLKATFLERAGSIASKEYSFIKDYENEPGFPEQYSYFQVKQLVTDINAAYDCANLPRPIIQGEILETRIDFKDVEIIIPQDVINAFQCEMTSEEILFYSNEKYFTWSRMNQIDDNGSEWHTFDKIESRMWFYFVAKEFVDLGYKAIHLGIYPKYANKNSIDPGYAKLSHLTDLVRSYADFKNTFVLLNGETGLEESPKIEGTNNLIFDFDSRAIRPHEIESPNSGDFDCNSTIPVESTIFNAAPCDQEDFPAILDPCVIAQFGGSIGGVAPSGCTYMKVPYILHWDFGSGILGELNQDGCFQVDPLVVNGPSPTQELTYGYEDTRWFANHISDECKSAWLESSYCQFRDELGGDGFLSIPLLIPIKYPELYNYPDCQTDGLSEPIADGAYIMTDNQEVLEDVIAFLEPSVPTISLTSICEDIFYCSKICNDNIAPLGHTYTHGVNKYLFSIENSDCSSTYSWHIWDVQYQNWIAPQVIGNTRTFYPPHDGNFEVSLRQDNLGLEDYNTNFGVNQVMETYSLKVKCCDDLVATNNSLCRPYHPRQMHEDEILPREVSLLSNTMYPVQICIYNQIGRKIFESKTNISSDFIASESIFNNLSLEPGIYFIFIVTDSGELINQKKIILNN